MTTVAGDTALRVECEDLLSAARRRVHRAAVRAQTPIALDRALVVLAGAAGAYALLRLGCVLAGAPVTAGWRLPACLLVAVALVPVVVTIATAWRHPPSLTESAERLDLGAGSHNRIAIALALLEQDGLTGFTQAAVEDGLIHLRRLKNGAPCVTPVTFRWRRSGCLGGAFVVLIVFAALFGDGLPTVGGAVGLSGSSSSAGREPSGGVPAEQGEPGKPPVRRLAVTTRADERGGESAAPDRRLSQERLEPAGRRSTTGAASAAVPANQAASAAGESAGAATASASRKSGAGRKRKARSADRARPSDRREASAPQDSSAVQGGSSGGGTMSPVQHDWALRVQAGAGEGEEEDTDEEVEDERESSRQRGGIQPSLKDRNEAPSRELGISGEQGPPGTGRGGPTPPKKSRGTASLVLGVPIPDFVRGRLGPGMTKVTHERVEPAAMPGEPGIEVEAARRAVPEAPCRRFDVPVEYAAIVRDYLIALHSADRQSTDTTSAKE